MKESESGIPRLLDRIVLFLIVFQVTMRALVTHVGAATPSASFPASPSVNLFCDSLAFCAMTVFLLARLMKGRAVLRFCGVEVYFLVFVMTGVLSVSLATYKIVALEYASGYAACLLMFVLFLTYFGRERVGVLWQIFCGLAVAILAYGLLQRFALFDLMRRDDAAKILTASPQGRERIAQDDIFSTFIYANVFGSYLAFLIPILLGAALDARRLSRPMFIYRIVLIVAAVAALVFASSKGAYLATGLALCVFAMAAWPRWARAILALMIVGGLLGGYLLRNSESVRVRLDYWKAGLAMIKRAPIAGVGLDNYQEHFTELKGDSSEETTKAHNDYLQVWTETGFLGLAALVAFWFAALRRVRPQGPTVEGPPLEPESVWLVASAMVLGFAAAYLLWGTMNEFSVMWAILGTLAGIVVTMTWNTELELLKRAHYLRFGIFAGLVGVAAHLLIDFDWYEINFVELLLVMIAVAIALFGRCTEIALDRTLLFTAGAAVLAVTLGFVGFLIPKFVRADSLKRQAAWMRHELETNPKDELASQWVSTLEAAKEANRLDPETYERLAAAYMEVADRFRLSLEKEGIDDKKKTAGLVEYLRLLDLARMTLEDGIHVRPRHAPMYLDLGRMYIEYGDHFAAISTVRNDPRNEFGAKAAGYFELAVDNFRTAIDLYPSSATLHYWHGKALNKLHRDQECRSAWSDALRFSKASRYPWLQLAPEQIRELERFLSQTSATPRYFSFVASLNCF